ncbi:cell division protein ZipA [Psychromonas sp.]|uniref:cell division protein ZipA n=1 Tax=Psychromonas sp. TaxID=1884585 RepID=UPI003562C81E
MQHFQSILIFIGLLAIGAVLIHGYFISRKEKAALLEKQHAAKIASQKENNHGIENGIIDDLEFTHPREEYEQDEIDFSKVLDDQDMETINFGEQDDFDEQECADGRFSDADLDTFSGEHSFERQEADSQGKIVTLKQEGETDSEEKRQSITEAQKNAPEDVFVFNVVAKEGTQIRGSEILQFFITSGFRFGENAFFHRHLNSDGTGPILFSIANMMAPGVFDPDNMEQFVSEGISFFVVAPNPEINVKEAFDLMLTAVQQMTDEFECLVLNENREPFTEQQFRDDHKRLMRYV